MPQAPLSAAVALTPTQILTPLHVDTMGSLKISGSSAQSSALNITTSTVVKAAPGQVVTLIVNVAGSTTGTLNDTTTTGGATTANTVFVIPDTVGIYKLNWPFLSGIVAVPGTGQTLAIAYS